MLVKVKILDGSGHAEMDYVNPHEALVSIKEHAQNGLWIYVDGMVVPQDQLNIDHTSNSGEIILTPILQGG